MTNNPKLLFSFPLFLSNSLNSAALLN